MLNQPLAKKRQVGPVDGLVFAAHFNPADGFGEMSKQILMSLSKLCNVNIATPSIYHAELKKLGFEKNILGIDYLRHGRPESSICIQPLGPNMMLPVTNKSALFTMWESSNVNEYVAEAMSQYDLLLTPNTFNAARFQEQTGRPCETVYHGTNSKLYRSDLNAYEKRLSSKKPFVFGAAAHLGHGRIRKGFERIIDWFRTAFPGRQNVKLLLKANQYAANNITAQDPRIEVIEKNLSDKQCASWLRSLDCYIDGSTFEGWGMWTHAAMATGRPVIGTNYSARCEYFKFANHIPIGYTIEPAQELYDGLGHWAMPKKEDAVAAMRWAYKNKKQCLAIAKEANQSTKHLTWDATADMVLHHLKAYKIISD